MNDEENRATLDRNGIEVDLGVCEEAYDDYVTFNQVPPPNVFENIGVGKTRR